MKVLYACDFHLKQSSSGKDRATRQKLEALSLIVDDFKVLSANMRSKPLRFMEIFLIEALVLAYLIFWRPSIFISRGHVGFLSVGFAKVLNVKTVREVHADTLGELKLLRFHGVKRMVVHGLAIVADWTNKKSDVRIYNHPDLLTWYRSNGVGSESDFFTYNGFDVRSRSSLSKERAREKFGLSQDAVYLVFTGGASEWHGVDYLLSLQKKFNEYGDNIKIVVGGGDISRYEGSENCINITPLEESGCADLIRAADVCLLPVKANRISPGSPLKLYDYIVNERFIAAQSNTLGYSDEVERHRVGFSVDFADPEVAREQIIKFLDSMRAEYRGVNIRASWADRMQEWLIGLRFDV
ncbi:MAG: hypothetical protein MK005_01895 [Alcanivorax sp.]|nr:hypothetical protein [Alcanivorax sp.]